MNLKNKKVFRASLASRERNDLLDYLGFISEDDLTNEEKEYIDKHSPLKLGDEVVFTEESGRDMDKVHIIDIIEFDDDLEVGYFIDLEQGGLHIYGYREIEDLQLATEVEVDVMRALVLQRIEEIKNREGFNDKSMRWRSVYTSQGHISETDLTSLTNTELIKVFERIISQFYKQM